VPTTATRHFHQLLSGLDGHLCDDFVADLRTRLAEGHVAEVANAVVFAAVAEPVALTGPEIDLLIATLAGQGENTTMARTIKRAGRPRQCRPA
jgi:hypothetical protein